MNDPEKRTKVELVRWLNSSGLLVNTSYSKKELVSLARGRLREMEDNGGDEDGDVVMSNSFSMHATEKRAAAAAAATTASTANKRRSPPIKRKSATKSKKVIKIEDSDDEYDDKNKKNDEEEEEEEDDDDEPEQRPLKRRRDKAELMRLKKQELQTTLHSIEPSASINGTKSDLVQRIMEVEERTEAPSKAVAAAAAASQRKTAAAATAAPSFSSSPYNLSPAYGVVSTPILKSNLNSFQLSSRASPSPSPSPAALSPFRTPQPPPPPQRRDSSSYVFTSNSNSFSNRSSHSPITFSPKGGGGGGVGGGGGGGGGGSGSSLARRIRRRSSLGSRSTTANSIKDNAFEEIRTSSLPTTSSSSSYFHELRRWLWRLVVVAVVVAALVVLYHLYHFFFDSRIQSAASKIRAELEARHGLVLCGYANESLSSSSVHEVLRLPLLQPPLLPEEMNQVVKLLSADQSLVIDHNSQRISLVSSSLARRTWVCRLQQAPAAVARAAGATLRAAGASAAALALAHWRVTAVVSFVLLFTLISLYRRRLRRLYTLRIQGLVYEACVILYSHANASSSSSSSSSSPSSSSWLLASQLKERLFGSNWRSRRHTAEWEAVRRRIERLATVETRAVGDGGLGDLQWRWTAPFEPSHLSPVKQQKQHLQ